ncbi:MAG: hypothetical protein OXJ90_08455 [Spirochaetaceae bacterium]|nr:hypothetical protein [Spirochaetaceae bacterium]
MRRRPSSAPRATLPLLSVLSLLQRTTLRRVLANIFVDQYRRNVRERDLIATLDHDSSASAVDPSLSLQVRKLLGILPEPCVTCGTADTCRG